MAVRRLKSRGNLSEQLQESHATTDQTDCWRSHRRAGLSLERPVCLDAAPFRLVDEVQNVCEDVIAPLAGQACRPIGLSRRVDGLNTRVVAASACVSEQVVAALTRLGEDK